MNDFELHLATHEDINVLVDLRIRFALELKGMQPVDKIESLQTQMRDFFSKAMSGGTCISVIARCGTEPAGIGSVSIREQPGNFVNPSGKWGYVMNMYTLPGYRRRGICTAILKSLVEESHRRGITAFELHATQTGEQVYVKNGFQKHYEPTYRKYL